MTMFGAFRGKLFGAGYWSNVAASWSSWLLRLEKDGSPQFEVDADGNVEAVGTVTAPILDLGATSTITDVTNSGVLGGIDNQLINADGCVVSGDKNTIEWAEYSAIIGGIESVIGQGADASEKSSQCFVAGGEAASGIGHSSRNCSVTGGYTTTIGNGCYYDIVGGGLNNSIGDGVVSSVIGGGYNNAITGAGGAVIPGGYNNAVSGTYGIASGIGASAAHGGAAVWCDSTGATTPLASSAANEWTARATGGFRLYNAADGSKYATLAAGELTVSDKVITPALKVTGGTPGAGKVLVSDADGDATWTAPAKRIITLAITPYGAIGAGGYTFGGEQSAGAVNGITMPAGFQPTRIELIGRNDGANGVDQQLSVTIGQISDAAYTEYDTLTLASTTQYQYKAERRTYDGVSGPGPWLTGRRLAVFVRRAVGNANWQQVSVVITAEADA
jgi:hypothetical protein